MGQKSSNIYNESGLNSLASSTPCGRRRSFRSPFLRRKKHKLPLSATFQAPCSSNFEALNINAATVEQFMTLPGVDRRIAQGIIEHRTAVGGKFQRVDDLALVSGIGAVKLEQMRREICIKKTTRSNQGSSISSRTPSLNSILSESNPTVLQNNSQKKRLNLNTSTVFQLQQLPGMNQELAANVIDYRNRKGLFKSLDQLIKIKGISNGRLGAIRSFLCIQEDDEILTAQRLLPKYQNILGAPRHRKSTSMPVKMCLEVGNSFISAPVNDIFDLLGAYSHRPVKKDDFSYERNGRQAIRIASWNLDRMCLEKSSNLGVREVICRTIFENCLSILCIQEIYQEATLQVICDELNNPKLKRCIEWKDNSKSWKWSTNITNNDNVTLNGLGLIYDANRCEFLINESFEIVFGDYELNKSFGVLPSGYIYTFRFADWKCRILNIYLRYYDLQHLNKVIAAIESSLRNRHLTISDIFMVVGDFTGFHKAGGEHLYAGNVYNDNNNETSDSENKKTTDLINVNLEDLGFFSGFESNLTLFNRSQMSKTRSDSYSSCNILCRERMPSTKTAFREALYRTKSPLSIYNQEVPSDGEKLCGYYGIIRDGLCHMAIPHGWVWGGPASEHLPIWVEVYKAIDCSTIHSAKTIPTPLHNDRSTGSARRRFQRHSSFSSCHSLNFVVNAIPVEQKKLERGITIAVCQSNLNNGDGNNIFYDTNIPRSGLNRNKNSSNNSVNKTQIC